jgi:hypothetical protein
VRIALHVAAQVAPPAHAVRFRAAIDVPGDLVGARAAGDFGRVAQHLLQARAFQDRQRVLRQNLVGATGGVDAVGEHVAVGSVGADVAGRVAGQRLRGDLRLAGGAGGVAETVSGRAGDHFLQQVEGIHRDHLQPGALQPGEQRAVVAAGQRGALRHRRGAAGAEARGEADIGDGGDHDVARAGVLQAGDDADLGRDRVADGGLRRRAGRDREQVVGAAPQAVQRVRVGLAAVGRQVPAGLRRQRRRHAQRAGIGHADAGIAGGVVVADLAVAVGVAVGVVVVGDVLRPDPVRIGRELAGHRLHRGR